MSIMKLKKNTYILLQADTLNYTILRADHGYIRLYTIADVAPNNVVKSMIITCRHAYTYTYTTYKYPHPSVCICMSTYVMWLYLYVYVCGGICVVI